MRKIILACLVLTIASALPADARSHKQTRPSKPVAHETTRDGDKSSAEKAAADTDAAMDKRIKSICRGC